MNYSDFILAFFYCKITLIYKFDKNDKGIVVLCNLPVL